MKVVLERWSRLIQFNEAKQDEMWDTIAWCAENHKMVWLKYETEEEKKIISRRVCPYSYRTRRTKIRG